jgi:Arc/MetJ family transcription regulator
MYMRTTLIIEPALLEEAMRASGLNSKSAAVRAGLESLIASAAAARLAALGGSLPTAIAAPRRRSAESSSVADLAYGASAAASEARLAVVRERPAPRKGKGRRR